MTYLVLRWLHLLFMAAWFGAFLFVASDVRRTLSADVQNLTLLSSRMKRAQLVSAVAGWLTLLTGFALIFALGGFAVVPVPVHIGMGITLVLVGLGAAGVGRTLSQIDAKLAAGDAPASLVPLAKRLAMLTGVFHLLWLVTFTLMVFRHTLMS